MDLEHTWQQKGAADEVLQKLLRDGNYRKLQSQLPLKKLRSNLLLGIWSAIIITVGYIILVFLVPEWQVRIALGVLIVSNLFITIDSWKLYRKTPCIITSTNSLKEELNINYNSFQRWWSMQERTSLFVYPIALAGGFILGGVLGSGKPVEAFLYNSKTLGILGIAILVLVPLCYWGAKWAFNHAYGKHLRKIKATIDELS